MRKKAIQSAITLVLFAGIASCNAANSEDVGEEQMQQPTMASGDAPDGLVSLFNGENLNGWHGFNKQEPIANWQVEDGALVCLGAAPDASGGDLVSDKEYENFELTWQWKVSDGANSGLMYHVIESDQYRAPYETGPEYQIIDDVGFPGKLEDAQTAGADYAMYVPNEKKKLMPVGSWNTSRIIFNQGHVEHWLNGEKILEFEAWSDDWHSRKQEGKWHSYPDYGMAKKGKIALQDHGNKVYFKEIYIKEL